LADTAIEEKPLLFLPDPKRCRLDGASGIIVAWAAVIGERRRGVGRHDHIPPRDPAITQSGRVGIGRQLGAGIPLRDQSLREASFSRDRQFARRVKIEHRRFHAHGADEAAFEPSVVVGMIDETR